MTSHLPPESQQDSNTADAVDSGRALNDVNETQLALDQPIDVLMRKVRLGWIAGMMSAVVSILVLYRLQPPVDMNLLLPLADAAIMVLLSFGVYRRNPWAAVVLLAYFTLVTVMEYLSGTRNNSLFSLLYGYFFYQAMTALFKLRALPKTDSTATLDSAD